MKLKMTGLRQFGLGAAVFNVIFGLPLSVLLAMAHSPIAPFVLPVLCGVTFLVGFVLAKRSGRQWRQEVTIAIALLFLQICCVSWMVPSLFTRSDSPTGSNDYWIPFSLLWAFVIAQKVVLSRQNKRSAPKVL